MKKWKHKGFKKSRKGRRGAKRIKNYATATRGGIRL